MSLVDVRREVAFALAQTRELLIEARYDLIHGEDFVKVTAAGEIDFLHRQERMLLDRLERIDRRLTDPPSIVSWMRQEWFNLMLQFESWIAHG
ncbi:MAG TPA: hypothetical protein VGL58_02190 [Caulobacteraceae bacterium]|jgi:hypothetical protein